MYNPESFREEDRTRLHAFIRKYSFGTLISDLNGIPCSSHLPFLLDAERGRFGVLRGHMARANPHWKSMDNERESLVLFQGPHAYISPSWYESLINVPTWNYATVHVYGVPRILEDSEETLEILRAMVLNYEGDHENSWRMDLPESYVHSMLRAIVGFEIPIERLEGKFKLNQNRSEADRNGVIRGLMKSEDPESREVARLMLENERKSNG